jgi:threonine dehydratase
MTLGWELVDQLRAPGVVLDRLVIQVGGGALASACIQALRWARDLGALERLPIIHAVQTAAAHPLEHAWRRVATGAAERLRLSGDAPPADTRDSILATWLAARAGSREVVAELEHAAEHRSEYMQPVAALATSVATGILDDETYDWPLRVDEKTLVRARGLASDAMGIPVDATGTAGLAGVLALSNADALGARERVGVLFTGARR